MVDQHLLHDPLIISDPKEPRAINDRGFLWGMSLRLSIGQYHLLFKQPFGTSHGIRTGTDAVFVRLERNGLAGYGEATMPPYVLEKPATVINSLQHIELQLLGIDDFKLDEKYSPSARSALSTAYYDLISKELGCSIKEILQLPDRQPRPAISLITLGLTELAVIPEKLHDLPAFNGLKVKLDGRSDEVVLKAVLGNDSRPVLLDANQAWSNVDHALRMIDLVGNDRLIGLEQPFPVDRMDLQEALVRQTPVILYGDESIRSIQDVERLAGAFTGVNLKLMKCGGLDRAAAMAVRADELGLKVMLGSMSESSLGCGAMLHLGYLADVIDLDGPWLITNDPFEGMVLNEGELMPLIGPGIGIRVRTPHKIAWTQFGA